MSNYPFNNPYANSQFGQQQFGQQQFGVQPVFNPYINQVAQSMQQPIQQLQQQPVVRNVQGRTINDISEVNANEVPNDGSLGYFPTSDGSAIFAKAWTGDGQIVTMKYVKEEQPTKAEEPELTLADVMLQINNLNDAVNALGKLVQQPTKATTRTAVKKEGRNA